jgi:anaphase-promoting complex subunit 4
LSKKDLQYGCRLVDNPGLAIYDIGPKLTHCRKLSGFQSGSITVSGSRKVSCVLSMSRRRVKLFDMDAEDEEEDDEDEVSKNESKEFEDTEDASL